MSEINEEYIAKKVGRNLIKIVFLITLYIFLSAVFNTALPKILSEISVDIGKTYGEYIVYINIAIALILGYLLILASTNFIYWNLRLKYSHSTAHAVRNVFKIIGVGVLISAIAGSIGGGSAGVALGGFIGMVTGFATQKILGQAVAGLFLLITRPFKIGDLVVASGEEGIVEDVTTMFTIIRKSDNTLVLIPNNTLIGGKIYIKRAATT